MFAFFLNYYKLLLNTNDNICLLYKLLQTDNVCFLNRQSQCLKKQKLSIFNPTLLLYHLHFSPFHHFLHLKKTKKKSLMVLQNMSVKCKVTPN